MDNSGDCPTIDWALIISTIPHYGLDNLPYSVRDFYLVSQVIANAAVCPRHKMNLLTRYLNALDDVSYWCITAVCDPNFFKAPGNIASASVDNCLLWVEALAAKWPLPGSLFTSASMHLLIENDIWMDAFFMCAGCSRTPAPANTPRGGWGGRGGSYLMEDGFFMVDGFQGESSANDLLTVLGEVDTF